jgi:aspartate kinase
MFAADLEIKPMIVQKFGGTSVGSAARMRQVADLATEAGASLLVLSAMSGTTNQLEEVSRLLTESNLYKAMQLLDEIERKHLLVAEELLTNPLAAQQYIQERLSSLKSDILLHYSEGSIGSLFQGIVVEGELFSTYLLAQYLRELGKEVFWFEASDAIQLNEAGEVDVAAIRERLQTTLRGIDAPLLLTQGFLCSDANGRLSNLGRGGSDYSAALLGAALEVEEIQIWTDIDGMHNNDPRYVEQTKALTELSYEEAENMAFFGASVLHPKTIQPAKEYSIPLRIKNTLNPSAKGSLVREKALEQEITAVAAKDQMVSLHLQTPEAELSPRFIVQVCALFERYGIAVEMLTTSNKALSLTVSESPSLIPLMEELKKIGQVEREDQLSLISVVGDLSADSKGIAERITSPLQRIPIRMITYGGKPHNFSVLVKTAEKQEALASLHENLFLN